MDDILYIRENTTILCTPESISSGQKYSMIINGVVEVWTLFSLLQLIHT